MDIHIVLLLLTVFTTKFLGTHQSCQVHQYLDDDSCLEGGVSVNLYNYSTVHFPPNNLGFFMSTLHQHFGTIGDKCNVPAEFWVIFDPLYANWKGSCFDRPSCEKVGCKKRMLRVDLEILEINETSDHKIVFNFHENLHRDIRADLLGVYFNEHNDILKWFTSARGCCNNIRSAGSFDNFFEPGVNWIRLYISHNFFRIMNNKGYDRWICDDCLIHLHHYHPKLKFTINGQWSRRFLDILGYGICKVHLKWVTCTCDKVWQNGECNK